ncbi:MAG TPA: hypothetical protein VEG34_05315 [Thermoanaerobaculia bacterium]|nr:hypothetical protein [Thermoanaerobaculia bacterium]
MAALAAPSTLATAGEDPCNPTSLPSHLSVLSLGFPNALVPHAHRLAVTAAHGKNTRMLGAIDDLVKKNKAFFQKANSVQILSQVVKIGKTPKTIVEMLSLFEAGWTPAAPSLCQPVSGTCKNTGCNDRCKQGGKYSGGECVGLFTDEPCSCVCNSAPAELALVALIVMALLATPGPEDIPGILGAISQTILRRAKP